MRPDSGVCDCYGRGEQPAMDRNEKELEQGGTEPPGTGDLDLGDLDLEKLDLEQVGPAAVFPNLDFLGEIDLRIGSVTLWHGQDGTDEPYFRAQMQAESPAWYSFVYYRITASYDGDGWIVRCEHNSCRRPLILRDHSFVPDGPLPAVLAAVAALAAGRINLFQELNRPWRAAREIDYGHLERARRAALPEAEAAVRRLGLTNDGERFWCYNGGPMRAATTEEG